MKKLLLTGFDPFGGAKVNPAWEAVRRMPERIGDTEICKIQIPTVYGKAAAVVLQTAASFRPDTILCVGQAGGRQKICPERIAVNIRDSAAADNAGVVCCGKPVVEGAPAAYFTTIPVEKIAACLQEASVPAAVSNHAGCFVCNDVFYELLHHFDSTDTKIGFVHVPLLPEQGSPSLDLNTIVRALEMIVETIG